MSINPTNFESLLFNCLQNFENISKFEAGDFILVEKGNIKITKTEVETNWKEVAEKVDELCKNVEIIITTSQGNQTKIINLLEKIEGAKVGFQRISDFFMEQSKPGGMEIDQEERNALFFKEKVEQLRYLEKLLKDPTDTAFETFNRISNSPLTMEEVEDLKSRKTLGELPDANPKRVLKRGKGKSDVAEIRILTEAAQVNISRDFKESIELITKRAEFIIIFGELTKFSKSPEFKPIGSNEWQIDLGKDITIEVDTPDMGKASYILDSTVKIRLSEGKIEFLDRTLKFKVNTPTFDQLNVWYDGEKWWNFITTKLIKGALKKTPPNIDLNVNSLQIKEKEVTFNVAVIFETVLGKIIAKKIPEFNTTQPLSEFLELLKAIKPE